MSERADPGDGALTVIVQRVCPAYRVPFFRSLARSAPILLVHGRGTKRGALKNAEHFEGFPRRQIFALQLDLRFLQPYLWISFMPTLFFHLARLRPKRIVCGGVSDFPNTASALLYAALTGVPVLIWDSGRRSERPMHWIRRLAEPLSRFVLARADACVAYGTVARRFFLSAGVPAERIFVAPNTLDVKALIEERERLLARGAGASLRRELGLADEAVVLLYVGAVEKRKRLESLVRVASDLVAAGEPVVLVVVGDGPFLPALRSLVGQGAARYVHLAGRVVEGVGRYFVAADLFVLPGPGGLSINQAMCYGLPVVVWGGDGTEEDLVEDAGTGFSVASEEQMRQRIRELVQDAPRRKEMGARAARRIASFDLCAMCAGFLDAFRFVLPSRAAGGDRGASLHAGGGRS